MIKPDNNIIGKTIDNQINEFIKLIDKIPASVKESRKLKYDDEEKRKLSEKKVYGYDRTSWIKKQQKKNTSKSKKERWKNSEEGKYMEKHCSRQYWETLNNF